MTYTLPVTQARKDLLNLVDLIASDYCRIDLTKKGRITATLVSPQYLDSLEETIFTLKNSLKDIKKSEEEIRQGKFITLAALRKNLRKIHAG